MHGLAAVPRSETTGSCWHTHLLLACRQPRRDLYVRQVKPPNKRLKLAGADRFKGSGVLCPWRGTDFVQRPCAGGRVARSLSAIRLAAAHVTSQRDSTMNLQRARSTLIACMCLFAG